MREAGDSTSLSRPRYVPDTNVCLDLFVFDDPQCASLLADVQAGRVELVTRQDCRAEWLAVLGYPQLGLSEARQEQARAHFDALVREAPLMATLQNSVALPRCRDPDDQKFLELAYQAQATALLTRDDELLRLARRTKKAGLFAILPPGSWQAALSSA
ncbi:putative toxin-antitoxin system toxin component, PIN family [Dyella mobilis]|uniref:Toxin-antitoxin system toxin component, PIN family n=1 Tax=Dyella mobilis TaxID=1849582 RepID=A0ABS2KGR8_9GAMM|nr:putative toxin-antitoxin system toxin component, PIN family [Dyella mobilis]MBM7130289.1 putative toxin-antitoxin system toxin component, PIN family [Dyella mobilis]GLQ96915.1 hypothetical protein GCM10007863_13350 [Dyella mobilis]